MAKKFQVFVSSTYNDLIEERQDALKSILDLGHIPSGMEGFFAIDQEQLKYIKKIIDECDYYVLIIAGRYGSVDRDGISYTEREYDYAASKGIAVLAFVHDKIDTLPSSKVDTGVQAERLTSFKEKVATGRLVRFWNQRENLKSDVIVSLVKAIGEMPGIGWVRGNVVASEVILAQLNAVRNEVDALRTENDALKEGMQPRVNNIASLDDLFQIGYKFYDNSTSFNRTEALSWSGIFRLIGPSFFNPAQPKTIQNFLTRFISQAHHITGSVYLVDAQMDTIKMQMIGYGFMKSYSSPTVSGGLSEFLQLTDIGKRVLIEIATVKASQ